MADKDEQNQQTDSPPTNQSEDEQDSKSDKDNDQFEGFDNLDEFEPSLGSDLEPVYEIPVHVAAVLGKASIPVSDLMQLRPGQTIELDRRVGEAIDIYVNDRLVARGEVVMVNENLGISMTEIIKMDEP
ncbi:MAG: flagellar motor switch protein FliN [Pseudomonadota bacterium]